MSTKKLQILGSLTTPQIVAYGDAEPTNTDIKIWYDTSEPDVGVGNTEIILDTTLTQAGVAADAAAVGTILGDLDDLDMSDKSSLVSAINEAAKTTVDTTLSQSGCAADSASVGVVVNKKVSLPQSGGDVDNGKIGQFAVSDGKGGISWKTVINAEEVAY